MEIDVFFKIFKKNKRILNTILGFCVLRPLTAYQKTNTLGFWHGEEEEEKSPATEICLALRSALSSVNCHTHPHHTNSVFSNLLSSTSFISIQFNLIRKPN